MPGDLTIFPSLAFIEIPPKSGGQHKEFFRASPRPVGCGAAHSNPLNPIGYMGGQKLAVKPRHRHWAIPNTCATNSYRDRCVESRQCRRPNDLSFLGFHGNTPQIWQSAQRFFKRVHVPSAPERPIRTPSTLSGDMGGAADSNPLDPVG